MSRLIDADKCPCNDCVSPLGDSRGCSIFPCREFGEWYKNTAYDVGKVVEEIWENYGDSRISNAIDIVRRGEIGVKDNR